MSARNATYDNRNDDSTKLGVKFSRSFGFEANGKSLKGTESESATQLPDPKSTDSSPFLDWLTSSSASTWTHKASRKQFARAKDCERTFWRDGEPFTTVLLTRCADDSDSPLLEQTQALSPRSYKAKRRRLLKSLDSDYAGVEVLAPKYDLPDPKSTDVRTHVHEMYWIPGHHSREAFEPLAQKHMQAVEGASGAHISVEHQTDEIYRGLSPQSPTDRRRGATTSLPYELARNMPLMNVETDASDLHDQRALKWCATLSEGSDDSHDTKGVRRFRPFGTFNDRAESVEDTYRRKSLRAYQSDKYRNDLPGANSTESPADLPTREERAFVDEYCTHLEEAESLMLLEDAIRANYENFSESPDVDRIRATVDSLRVEC